MLPGVSRSGERQKQTEPLKGDGAGLSEPISLALSEAFAQPDPHLKTFKDLRGPHLPTQPRPQNF